MDNAFADEALKIEKRIFRFLSLDQFLGGEMTLTKEENI